MIDLLVALARAIAAVLRMDGEVLWFADGDGGEVSIVNIDPGVDARCDGDMLVKQCEISLASADTSLHVLAGC